MHEGPSTFKNIFKLPKLPWIFIDVLINSQNTIFRFWNLSFWYLNRPLCANVTFSPTKPARFQQEKQGPCHPNFFSRQISDRAAQIAWSGFCRKRFLALLLVLVFCQPTSEFVWMSRCSKKTMGAFKRHKELYYFRSEPYVQSQRRSSACSSLECSKVLTMGVQEWWKR